MLHCAIRFHSRRYLLHIHIRPSNGRCDHESVRSPMNKQLKPSELPPPGELKSLVERGILIVTMSNGKIPKRIEETPEYQQFAELKTNRIHLREASRKYKVSPKTISRWIEKGFIKTKGTEGQRLLLIESYVAYCAYVYQQSGSGQGRWAFNKNGTPRAEGVNLRDV